MFGNSKKIYMKKKSSLILLLVLAITQYSYTQSLEEYQQQRNDLLSSDANIKLGADIILSNDEIAVDNFLSELRADFINQAGFEFPSAHYFYRYREMIDTSLILGILRKMPKGGLLHAHFPAVGSIEWIIKDATYRENCYIYIGANEGRNVYGQLKFFNPDEVPNGWESVRSLREKDSEFDNKLHKLLTFDMEQFLSPYVWDEFENVFTRMGGLLQYKPVFTDYMYNSIDSLAADNIQHFELRTFFSGIYDLDGKVYSQEECLEMLKEIGENVKSNHPHFTLKTIYCGYRGWSNEKVMEEINKAFELRSKHPDFVLGFDLVGEEDKGHTTIFFVEEFLKVDSLSKIYGVDLPFYFHDGESTLPDNDNLYDAILLNTKRIGHGLNLFRYPTLLEIVKERGIAMEVNPLSNQILGYTENLRMHPASEYINRGLPVTINSDDPQIFDYTGLSYDFWTAYMSWNLGLAQLKQLALNSLIYSGLSETEKETAILHFEREWENFIQDILIVKSLIR